MTATSTRPDAHPALADAVSLALRFAVDSTAGGEPCPAGHNPADNLVERLASQLYAEWYVGGAVYAQHRDIAVPADLWPLLRAAHAGNRRWETGWIVDAVGPSGLVRARRGGEVRALYRTDYVLDESPARLPQPGDALTVSGVREQPDPAGHWWYTHSAGWLLQGPPPPGTVRYYWNHALDALGDLVAELTGLLHDEAGGWMVKAARSSAVHDRPDAVVAYLLPSVVTRYHEPLCLLAERRAATARPTSPPLTRPVAPGLAIALDPADGSSFGQHRCRQIAAAALTAMHAGGTQAFGDTARAADRASPAAATEPRPRSGMITVLDPAPTPATSEPAEVGPARRPAQRRNDPRTVDAAIDALWRAGIDVARPWRARHDEEMPWDR